MSDTVFTISYSGLSYSTTYIISISGFKDAAGNTLALDSSHSFTTMAGSSSNDVGNSTTYYAIMASAGTGGSITPSGNTSVAHGSDKTYTIAANDGYEIEDVLVDGVSVGAVSAYTFKNVKKAHTITVSFKKAVVKTANPFNDVPTNNWFYESVLYVYENGLMTGTSVNTFNPEGTMTRAMLVTVLYRLSGDTGSYLGSFTDVPPGKWYENAVAWAAKRGIARGVGNNRFSPDGEITREQLAVMLHNFAKYKGLDVSVSNSTVLDSHADTGSISSWASEAMAWAVSNGIITGDDSGNLNPQSFASRAEVAAMLKRFIENVMS